MSLDIAQEQRGDVRILALTGRLDLDSAATLQLALEDLLNAGASHLVLDLTGLGYLSSVGADAIVATAERLKTAGSLRLCGIGPGVKDVLAAVGQGKRLAIYPDRNAALADHPSARLDPALVSHAAGLMGAGAAPTEKPGKAAAEMAQAAAKLLGATAPKAPTATKPIPIPEPVPEPPRKDGGLLGKLKGLFGGED